MMGAGGSLRKSDVGTDLLKLDEIGCFLFFFTNSGCFLKNIVLLLFYQRPNRDELALTH